MLIGSSAYFSVKSTKTDQAPVSAQGKENLARSSKLSNDDLQSRDIRRLVRKQAPESSSIAKSELSISPRTFNSNSFNKRAAVNDVVIPKSLKISQPEPTKYLVADFPIIFVVDNKPKSLGQVSKSSQNGQDLKTPLSRTDYSSIGNVYSANNPIKRDFVDYAELPTGPSKNINEKTLLVDVLYGYDPLPPARLDSGKPNVGPLNGSGIRVRSILEEDASIDVPRSTEPVIPQEQSGVTVLNDVVSRFAKAKITGYPTPPVKGVSERGIDQPISLPAPINELV